jgi:hypothetical protein
MPQDKVTAALDHINQAAEHLQKAGANLYNAPFGSSQRDTILELSRIVEVAYEQLEAMLPSKN